MRDRLEQLAADLYDRALTYSFLARAFSDDEISIEFLDDLREDVPETGTELDAFAASLADLDGADLEDVRKELAADHSRLLLNMGTHPVSPFESYWRSDQHILMQDSRDEVVKAYGEAGFGVAEEYHMPEDHISLELDFMAGLGNRAADYIDRALGYPWDEAGEEEEAAVPAVAPEAEGDGDPEDFDFSDAFYNAELDTALQEAELAMNTQLDFLQKHLCVWVPQFCEAIEAHAQTQFYRGLAQMLDLYLKDEKSYLESYE